MIETWSQFLDFFGIGVCCGFTVGLLALGVRRVRLTMYNAFRASMRL